jgi:hypothetical protein
MKHKKLKENLIVHLESKSLPEITEFINELNPDQPLKTLKCKKAIAIVRAIDRAIVIRQKRNRKQFKKLSRRLLRFA